MFKVELHAHARTGSCDSDFDEKSLVVALKRYGYDGFVLTNHYDKLQLMKYSVPDFMTVRCSDYIMRGRREDCPFEKLSLDVSGSELRKYYYKWIGSLRLAMAFAEKYGIRCFAGMEYKISTGEHIAVLGCAIEDFESEYVRPEESIDYIYDYSHRHGGIVIQNHPLRHKEGKIQTKVDGYEYINTKHGVKDVVDKSRLNYKNKDNTIFVCGSDVHSENELGKVYTCFRMEPDDEIDLVQMLKLGVYENCVLKDIDNINSDYKQD